MVDNLCLFCGALCRRDRDKTKSDWNLPLDKVLHGFCGSMNADRVREVDWNDGIVNILPDTGQLSRVTSL